MQHRVTPSPGSSGNIPPESAVEVIAIAASLGGLPTLQSISAALPPTFPVPVLVVQHLSDRQRSWFPELLARSSALPVCWAGDGVPLSAGTIYVAPQGRHLVVTGRGTAALSDAPHVNFTRPSADPLFLSVAEHYGQRALGIILSGRLKDGAAGAAAMREAGAVIIVQEPSTCRASGMPRAAISAGAVDLVLPPERIAEALIDLTSRPHPGRSAERTPPRRRTG